jgi:hypothetical protein
MFTSSPLDRWRALPKSRRRRLEIVAVVGVVALWLAWPRSSDGPPIIPPPTIAMTDVLTVEAPEQVDAGDDFWIDIDGATPGVEIRATLEAGYGRIDYPFTPEDAQARIDVTAVDGPASGDVLLTITQGAAVATRVIEIEPGPPTDPIDVYLGPRTVIADAAHFVMLVAIPEDEFGNPVAEGTRVDFTTTRPNLVVEQESHETEDLLAWYEVFSRTVTGRTRIATESGDAGAPERDFLEVADIPVPFEIELVDPIVPADGQALIRVRSDVLVDEFGNVMPDGVVAYLDTAGVTGTRRIHGQTIDGRAEFTLEVPDRPGSATLMIIASGTRSGLLEVEFPTAVASMTAEVERNELTTMIHVGPIRSVRGSFVPEGAIAEVELADGAIRSVDLSLGIGTGFFPADADTSRVTVRVLGSEFVLEDE